MEFDVKVVPHLPARHLGPEPCSITEYATFVQSLYHLGVRDLLLVGGDVPSPLTTFASCLELLQSPVFEGCAFTSVGFGGHPDGNPYDHDYVASLQAKLAFVREHPISSLSPGTAQQWPETFCLTQVCFNAARLRAFISFMQRRNEGVKVVAGLPGPVDGAGLLQYAELCGVKTSLELLRRHGWSLGRGLATRLVEVVHDPAVRSRGEGGLWYSPKPVVNQLFAEGIDHFHFYSFAGLEPTLEWLQTMAD